MAWHAQGTRNVVEGGARSETGHMGQDQVIKGLPCPEEKCTVYLRGVRATEGFEAEKQYER